MENLINIISAANDTDEVEAREKGIRLIDGSFPGYALLVGEGTDLGVVDRLLQRKILIFATSDGIQSQIKEAGYSFGWESGILAYDLRKSLGFIYRVAQIFGNSDIQADALNYAIQRLGGFTLLVDGLLQDYVSDAYSALPLGSPLLSTTDLPATVNEWRIEAEYPAAIGNVPMAEIVQVGIEQRGLNIKFETSNIPIAISSEFSGQIVREEACAVCLQGVELTTIGKGIVDGQINVVGADLDSGLAREHGYGLLVEVSGREMQPDFEAVLERQIDVVFNELDGVMHRGQRSIASVRISQKAIDQGFRLRHLGEVLHARYHNEFGAILSRVQITIYTEVDGIQTLKEKADTVFRLRDDRLLNLTDEDVDTFYTCTICQSISGKHICVISPERPGVCGAVDWMDARAGTNILPTGPNKAIKKEDLVDEKLGQWESVNQIVQQEVGGAFQAYSLYSLMQDPGTACGDFECITAVLPSSNGVMIVGRGYKGMTPSGMDWDILYEIVGGGEPVPGFIGHSKRALHREKYISAEGGWRRILWMDHKLREELRPVLEDLAGKAGINGFVDMIMTEEDVLSEEEILESIGSSDHPVLSMGPML